MTRREQMIECAEQMELLMGITNYYVACRMGAEALRALDAQEKPKTPCDLCLYNPPSSGDGKPCTMCPASSLPEPPKEEKR